MAANGIAFDVIEEILARSEVEDVMRWKSVCKSLYSLISTPSFAESHLKHAYKRSLNTKRIFIDYDYGILCQGDFMFENRLYMIGSSSGLVCISPKDFELLVVNPCTRQMMKINQPPPEPLPQSNHRWWLVWGFGYDSSNDDYKIVVGLDLSRPNRTRFYVYSLKSCLWKFVQETDHYVSANPYCKNGALCDGVLHWLMTNRPKRKKVIVCFDLSREEFFEIQSPDHPCFDNPSFDAMLPLGVMEDCLCIYNPSSRPMRLAWLLRTDDGGNQSWLLLPKNYVMNHDVAYQMNRHNYSYDDTPHFSIKGKYIGAPIFVQSLVSPPHVNMEPISNDVPILKKHIRIRLGKKRIRLAKKRNAKSDSNGHTTTPTRCATSATTPHS